MHTSSLYWSLFSSPTSTLPSGNPAAFRLHLLETLRILCCCCCCCLLTFSSCATAAPWNIDISGCAPPPFSAGNKSTNVSTDYTGGVTWISSNWLFFLIRSSLLKHEIIYNRNVVICSRDGGEDVHFFQGRSFFLSIFLTATGRKTDPRYCMLGNGHVFLLF